MIIGKDVWVSLNRDGEFNYTQDIDSVGILSIHDRKIKLLHQNGVGKLCTTNELQSIGRVLRAYLDKHQLCTYICYEDGEYTSTEGYSIDTTQFNEPYEQCGVFYNVFLGNDKFDYISARGQLTMFIQDHYESITKDTQRKLDQLNDKETEWLLS